MTISGIPDNLRQTGPEVFVAAGPVTFLSARHIACLKEAALASDKKRARICLHKTPDDPVHEMVIAVHKSSYIPPHAHPHKEESFHLIEGQCDVLLFSETGAISKIVPLRPAPSETAYFYRIGANIVHGLKIHTDWIVFHEAAAGPFTADSNHTPGWVPAFEHMKDGIAWVDDLFALALAEHVSNIL